MSTDWLDEVADALGVDRDVMDRNVLLGLTRDVAHGVERKAAPLSVFLVGSGTVTPNFFSSDTTSSSASKPSTAHWRILSSKGRGWSGQACFQWISSGQSRDWPALPCFLNPLADLPPCQRQGRIGVKPSCKGLDDAAGL